MLLHDEQTGTLIEVVDTTSLIDPTQTNISGRIQSGQEEQPPEEIAKNRLTFPSGEKLPQCWVDADYRNVKD